MDDEYELGATPVLGEGDAPDERMRRLVAGLRGGRAGSLDSRHSMVEGLGGQVMRILISVFTSMIVLAGAASSAHAAANAVAKSVGFIQTGGTWYVTAAAEFETVAPQSPYSVDWKVTQYRGGSAIGVVGEGTIGVGASDDIDCANAQPPCSSSCRKNGQYAICRNSAGISCNCPLAASVQSTISGQQAGDVFILSLTCSISEWDSTDNSAQATF